MHQLIPAYIYMRHYQHITRAEKSKFKLAFLKCYVIMTNYYCALVLSNLKDHPEDADYTLALRIFQVLSIQANKKEGLSCLSDLQISAVVDSVDKSVCQYYHASPPIFQKSPRLKEYFPLKP